MIKVYSNECYFQCNQKTLPIREQRIYKDLKRAAIKREFAKIDTDFAEMRLRILPVKEDVKERREMVKQLVKETILTEDIDQNAFDQRMNGKLAELAMIVDKKMSLTEIKQRGRHIREILNKTVQMEQ